tara:strand:- start:8118 stop:9554 length:1437 start_codon:yes stop_codon:yes gene_type:complete
MKTLVSWIAKMHDFELGEFKPNGTHGNFHIHFYEKRKYDRHIVLYSNEKEDREVGIFRTYMSKKYKDRQFEYKCMNVNDVIDVQEIQQKIDQLLISHKEDEIEIFVSPGTPAMQTAWYFCHARLGLKTKLIQTRPGRFTKSKIPEFIEIELKNNSIGNTSIHALTSSGKRSDKIQITVSIQPIYEQATKIALTDGITTLIKGQSGTGKENLARFIHDQSIRKDKAYVTINCSAIGDQLLESRLFGYKKGAFTDAKDDRPGLFKDADEGTIFLDEIGDISPYMQQSLLRVIQEDVIMPVGGKEQKINVRIIAATHQNLIEKCKKGEFRWDLYYRLSIVELTLPSLMERGQKDIKAMLKFLLKKKKKDLNKSKVLKLSKDAEKMLVDYTYPGNIREMENIITKLYVFNEEQVEKTDLPAELNQSNDEKPLNIEHVEKEHIERVLQIFNGNRSKSAEAIGWAYNTLNNKVKKYKLGYLIKD